MPEKKIIAVVGATGAQGGGLVRAILSDKDSPFTARAITRNVDSDKAKELAKLGAEVVSADVDDPPFGVLRTSAWRNRHRSCRRFYRRRGIEKALCSCGQTMPYCT